MVYDDNLFIQSRDKTGDLSFELSPTLALGVGDFRREVAEFAPIPRRVIIEEEADTGRKDYLFFSGTPTLIAFAREDQENTLDWDLRMAGARQFQSLTLSSNLYLKKVSEPVIEVGRRVKSTVRGGSVAGTYGLTGKMALQADVNYSRTHFSGFNTSETKGSAWLAYDARPKTRVGVGLVAGWASLSQGIDQRYQQALIKIRYSALAKLSLAAELGAEFRQYATDDESRSHLVYSLQLGYQVRDATGFTVSVDRKVRTSIFKTDEDIFETSSVLGVKQRLYQRLYASFGVGYTVSDYKASAMWLTPGRRDRYLDLRSSIAWEFTRRGSLEIIYTYSNNDSSFDSFRFNQNRAQLRSIFVF